MAFKKQSGGGPNTMCTKKAAATLISPLESRGSKMLRAALNNKTPLRDRVLTDEHANYIMSYQQVSSNRKRSPKNNVLFREPVVSQEFQYEQTYFEDVQEPIPEVDERAKEEKLNEQRTSDRSENQNTANTARYPNNDPQDIGEDEDGDIFIMASDELEDFNSYTKAAGAKKRLHAQEDDEIKEMKQTGRSESSGGGLFSSPKVAKIAPYFHDELPHERRSTINKNRLKSLQQRSLCTRRYTIKRSDSVLAQSGKPFDTTPSGRVNDLTLSSYKKFSSPQIYTKPEPASLPPMDETNCKSEANGYLGWIATFITNQMNKLIF